MSCAAVPSEDKLQSSARDLPFVSVVIITKDRHAQAEAVVRSIEATDYPARSREIIVVEETDQPRPITGAQVRYHAIPLAHRGFAYARNTGVSLAQGEIIAFTDDDCAIEKTWLRELVQVLIDNPAGGAVGGAVLVPRCGPIGEGENILGFPGGGMVYVHQADGNVVRRPTFSTCNCALRKEAILKGGGFDERMRLGGEDEMLSRRLQSLCHILFAPRAVVRHAPRDNLAKVFLWFIRRGRARMRTIKADPSLRNEMLSLVKNSILVRITLVTVALVITGTGLLPGYLAVGGLYYAAVLWRYRWSRKYYPSKKTFLLIPLVKMCMDCGMDLGIAATLVGQEKQRP